MLEHKLTAAGHNITVTNTATSLYDLIDTAAGAAQSLPKDLTECIISAEDGNIRFLLDGTPTASVGEQVYLGEKKTIIGNLSSLKLIRAGGSDVACSVRVGWTEPRRF